MAIPDKPLISINRSSRTTVFFPNLSWISLPAFTLSCLRGHMGLCMYQCAFRGVFRGSIVFLRRDQVLKKKKSVKSSCCPSCNVLLSLCLLGAVGYSEVLSVAQVVGALLSWFECTCNPSTQETEAGRSWIQGQLGFILGLHLQKRNKVVMFIQNIIILPFWDMAWKSLACPGLEFTSSDFSTRTVFVYH